MFLFCFGYPPERRDLWKICLGALGIAGFGNICCSIDGLYSSTGTKLFFAIFDMNFRFDEDLLVLFKSAFGGDLYVALVSS